jgi:hypothetical protein
VVAVVESASGCATVTTFRARPRAVMSPSISSFSVPAGMLLLGPLAATGVISIASGLWNLRPPTVKSWSSTFIVPMTVKQCSVSSQVVPIVMVPPLAVRGIVVVPKVNEPSDPKAIPRPVNAMFCFWVWQSCSLSSCIGALTNTQWNQSWSFTAFGGVVGHFQPFWQAISAVVVVGS